MARKSASIERGTRSEARARARARGGRGNILRGTWFMFCFIRRGFGGEIYSVRLFKISSPSLHPLSPRGQRPVDLFCVL